MILRNQFVLDGLMKLRISLFRLTIFDMISNGILVPYWIYCITTTKQEFTYQPSYDRQLSYQLVISLWLVICTACLPVRGIWF